ncbi:MAG: NfeD family protein [Phycisphaerae bacterium]|nr:NfeD family protein [Phycisphaerae bacterium]
MESLKDMLRPEIIWLLVGLGLMFLELMLPGLIVLFFGLGAMIVAAVCFFAEITINQQLGLFILTSILMLVAMRGLLRKVFRGHAHSASGLEGNLSEFIGEHGVVKQTISPRRPGKIEFHGSDWAAVADGTIEAGATVEITGRENITLKVKQI